MDLYKVLVKTMNDGKVETIAQHVDRAAASTAAAAHKNATRFIVRESDDAIVSTYRPVE